jgi:hypothetical protein
MRIIFRSIISIFLTYALFAALSCSAKIETNQNVTPPVMRSAPSAPQPTAVPTPSIPNLQADLLDVRDTTTKSPLGTFDFKNYSYPLPHGWENPDGSDATLVNGRLQPVGVEAKGDMTDEEKADAKATRRIGMTYVTTKYMDVTGDGQDEALVILKIETGGSAIPQVVYVFTWKDGKPELIWPFRTGDRADGGLKDLRAENGELVVELYGQDRFVLGQMETGKVGDDREQLCCPTYFTRSIYKWNGKNFLMQGKRLTFSVADPHAESVENLSDNAQQKSKR